MLTRRGFLQTGVAGAAAAAQTGAAAPWYRRCYRWGQTNITERDPVRYDIAWWRDYWKRTEVQGVIINAGGIVAYYPSKFPLHHRAEFLNGRDLYGELAQAAHEDGLAVLARMDSNRTAEDFFRAHPDWFARDASGQPYRAGRQVHHVRQQPVLRRVPARRADARLSSASHPEGFTDNSWSGLGRDSICYCDNCARKFRDRAGKPLPAHQGLGRSGLPAVDSVELRAAPGNLGPQQSHHQRRGRAELPVDRHEQRLHHQPEPLVSRLRRRSASARRFMLLDHQARADESGFQQNGDTGKLVHGLLGLGQADAGEHGACTRRGARPSAWPASRPRKRACG